jgi:hypothetical protein
VIQFTAKFKYDLRWPPIYRQHLPQYLQHPVIERGVKQARQEVWRGDGKRGKGVGEVDIPELSSHAVLAVRLRIQRLGTCWRAEYPKIEQGVQQAR